MLQDISARLPVSEGHCSDILLALASAEIFANGLREFLRMSSKFGQPLQVLWKQYTTRVLPCMLPCRLPFKADVPVQGSTLKDFVVLQHAHSQYSGNTSESHGAVHAQGRTQTYPACHTGWQGGCSLCKCMSLHALYSCSQYVEPARRVQEPWDIPQDMPTTNSNLS